ncbi:MAG: LamG domain-containing protein [Sedimentisphaerales bacterium]
MRRGLIDLCCFVFVCGLMVTNRARGELVGWWRLDEGTGATAFDSSPNGNDAAFQGAPTWVEDGKLGKALRFNGSSDYLAAPDSDSLDMHADQLSLMAWINAEALDGARHVVRKIADTGTGAIYFLRVQATTLRSDIATTDATLVTQGQKVLPANEWIHVAVIYDGAEVRLYVNGEQDVTLVVAALTGEVTQSNNELRIGRGEPAGYFQGMIDDVRVYNHALTEEELASVMVGTGARYPVARNPKPADGALLAQTWATLSWSPGDFAVTHDVYLGDNFDDVNAGAEDSFQGNQDTTSLFVGFPGAPYPEGLVPGTTYYWRVDEVNDSEPNSPWRGPVWSFSIPPNTAYNPSPADGAEFVDPNAVFSWTPGFGARLHTVYMGTNFDEVDAATGGTLQGDATYRPGPLQPENIYYWRVDEFDGVLTYKGDIWAFTTPGAAGAPMPANGAVNIAHDPILSWTPAATAASHQLYFGTDEDAVENATTSSPEYKGEVTLGNESYEPGKLDWNTAYYWRVDAVYDTGPIKGLVWSFATADFIAVDDFESYTDDDTAGLAIWQTWIDGFGIPDNGAQVGYLLPPYCEQTIVHSGTQSMPLLYNNEGGVTNSEATLSLTTNRDWTAEGVGQLSLWYQGGTANATEPLYVAVANKTGTPAVVARGQANAAQATGWTQWVVPLQAFADQGINLLDVNSLAIGLGTKAGVAAPGGTGTIYIDDIRLYR